MFLEYKPFDYKASVQDEGKGIIHAVVSIFGNEDSYGDVMVKGAFERSIKDGEKKGKLPPGVWSHDWERPIAKTLKAWETDEGLNVIAQFNLETKDGQDAYSNVKNGLFTEYSFGFKRVKDGEEEKEGKNYVKEVEWLEWSPVLVGANRDTYTASIKSAQAMRSFAAVDPAKLDALIGALKPDPPLGGWEETTPRYEVVKLPDGSSANFTITPVTNEPEQDQRLTKIRAIATRKDAEEILCNAGFSKTERAAFISSVKTLLGNPASDDADAAATDTGEEAPAADADIPATEQDATPTDGETPPQDEPKADGEVIVTDPDPIVAYNSAQLAEQKAKIARDIARSLATLDATITLALACHDGR